MLCLTMAAAVLSASFAVFLVRERESNSKALQLVAGAPCSAFWASTFAWDLLNFSLPALGASDLHDHMACELQDSNGLSAGYLLDSGEYCWVMLSTAEYCS